MKIKIYIGLFFVLITFLLNYLDQLFPSFTDFTILGKSFKIVEGFDSHDIIWTIVQKINLVFFSIGILLIFPFEKSKKTHINFTLIIVFLSSISVNLYLTVTALNDYLNGFGDGHFIMTFTILISFVVVILLLFLKLNKIINDRKNEMLRLKSEIEKRVYALKEKDLRLNKIKSNIELKVDTIQDANLSIANKIENLESLPLFISVYDNMEDWTRHSKHKAKKIYNELDMQLKELESIKVII